MDAGLAGPELVGRLNVKMKELEGADGLRERVLQTGAIVKTTDATVTVIATEVIPVSTSVLVAGYVVARRTGGAAGTAEDGAAYRVEFVAKNAAGTAAAIGSAVTVIGESQAGWDVTVVASGGNVLVKVTGAVNNNVTWKWSRRTFAVAT